eukprot:TRINITY_DN104748_c0_g1_i1.p1 TRINITY_DN104748_c0_g1~~TRINITY_DN104748_c0_g1_i1.p1  ORF type:complete len:309 (+),score=40.50 TRINITY_DN104748_c0_g1_i1:81-929(+)
MPGVFSTSLETFRWYEAAGEQKAIFWTCSGLLAQFGLAAVTLLSGVNAPYGRYNQADEKAKKSLPERLLASCDVPSKVAWVIQESPTLISAALSWMNADPELKQNTGNVACLMCFVAHYINRTLIFPFRSKGSKPIPLPVMLMATSFCAVNGWIQCRSLTKYMKVDTNCWLTPVGVGIWALGLYINMDADDRLRNLRKPGETGYKIPRGGAFDYVSGANFFGEIVEWFGYAMATGFGLPALTFAICTACNIGPRAVAHHKWYLDKFKDEYPKERKAVIPFIY